MRRWWVWIIALGTTWWGACGAASTEMSVGAAGGELCSSQKHICLVFPQGALEKQVTIRLAPTTDVPGDALSDGFEVSVTSGEPPHFLKAATVSFSFDAVHADSLAAENGLRVYVRLDGVFVPLDKPVVDRVLRTVRGETAWLSTFVVLRADRLEDGGVPVDVDAGQRDAAVIGPPPFDAGRPDAGARDAGMMDGGPRDAGVPDAGTPVDAGMRDAGIPDAGRVDSGVMDAGVIDAGTDAGVDAGFDAGAVVDAGTDAGMSDVDAGTDIDAGNDAGADDAG